jgi:hypothetical protein
MNYIGDYEQIQKEWEEELQMKSEIPAKVKAEYGTSSEVKEEDNPDAPKVDNNDKGKSIAE